MFRAAILEVPTREGNAMGEEHRLGPRKKTMILEFNAVVVSELEELCTFYWGRADYNSTFNDSGSVFSMCMR